MQSNSGVRNLTVALLTLISSVAFAGSTSVTIRVDVTGQVPQKEIYLYEHFGTDVNVIDTAIIAENSFEFKIKHHDIGLYRIGYVPEESGLFVVTHETINATCDLQHIAESWKTINSEENEAFEAYSKVLAGYYQGLSEVDREYKQAMAYRAASEEKYNAALTAVRAKFDSLNNAINEFYKKSAEEQSHLFVGKISVPMVVSSETTAENYFTKADFTKPIYFSNDLIQRKVNHYFMVFSDRANLQGDVDRILSFSEPKTPGRELAYRALINRVYVLDKEMSKNLARSYDNEFPDSEVADKLISFFPPEVGDKAPDIALPNVDGEIIKLSSLRGKVVLLDFWASWCGPCRRENPNVVKAYEKYKDEGFIVYSVSLDRNKASWEKAILQDGLVWDTHVSDLKHWQSEGAATYKVTGIPMAFLIDQNGVIIGKNLRGRSLDQKLEEIFSK